MMAKWERKLHIKESWDGAKEGRISIQELSREIAAKLRALRPFGNDLDIERDDLAEQFEDIANDPSCTVADFDALMDCLYDWGDTPLDDRWNGRKACWISAAI